ncbi:GNAT family N-acetyltransferase [Mesorhizobium mediterraneum]|uniref:GNAT family N-acetyltransferase n=1 Tax=Mesorhizobium mediterraneum TaxID=43617 RepID=UPI001FEE3AC0|nr:GNAT family N-acetyltransferase [Mesorhizobium mediterraneum]
MSKRSSGSPGKADWGEILLTEVTRSTRADFENLFEQAGGPKYCWCMAWRNLDNREHVSNDERKRSMMALIEAGTPVGTVAHAEGKTVGWCSIAPRETYRRLSRHQDDSETGIWSIVCFYVPRALRSRGLATALLDAAIDHASPKAPGRSRLIRSTRHRRVTVSWAFETCSWPAGSTRSAWPARAGM